MRRVRGATGKATALAGVLVAVAATSGCFAEPSPLRTVRDFLVAWQSGNYAKAAAQTDGDRKQVVAALRSVPSQLDLAALRLALPRPGKQRDYKPVVKNGDNATVEFNVNIDLGEAGKPWEYLGQMRLHRTGGTWKVVWSPSIIHPRLGPGQRLAVVTETPRRAFVQDSKGRPLLKKSRVQVFGVVPGSLREPGRTLSRFAKITNLDKDRVTGRVRSAPPQSFLPLVTLQLPESAQEAGELRQVPGVETRVVTMPVTPAAAREVVGQLGPATAVRLQQVGAPYQPGDTIGVSGLQLLYQRQLAGMPTVKVVAQDPSGANTQVLAEWRPDSLSAPLHTTIDRRVQGAAERALLGLRVPASLVAVHAATGEILGIANHLTGGQDRALEGRYAPGMTFSIATTQALLRYNQNLRAPLACPRTLTVGGAVFRDVASRGTTFQTNFARGCPTAFASLARTLSYRDLPESAARLGIGVPWSLPLPSFYGSVPQPTTEAERAQATVGEGKVQTSPLSMALAAAAVATGTWRPPQLLASRPGQPVKAQPLDPTPILALKSLMRQAVKNGSGKAADLPGTPVSGVTAAVVSGGTNVSWFVGYRGDVAFAVAIEGKVSAARTAAKFLRGR